MSGVRKDQEGQYGVVPDRKMKILSRFHLDRSILVLCCVFGASLLLTYQKLLNDQGLLKNRHYEERELFQILDNHRPSKDLWDDSVSLVDDWRETDGRRSVAVRSIKTLYDEEENDTTASDVNKKKYLIYLCNRQRLCGSWEDRQAAIVSTFILANLTKRIFKVSMTSPCRLQNYLIPKQYNWIPDIEELRGKPFTVINDDENSTFLETLQAKDFNSVYSQDTVFIRATTDFSHIVTQNPYYKNKLPRWMLHKYPLVFKNAWEMLMKPIGYLQNTMTEFLLRGSLFDFDDMVCFYVKGGNDTNSHLSYKEMIARFMELFTGKTAKVFIATDSNEFRNVTKTKFGNNSLDSGSPILDIDKDRFYADSCYALQTVILDQLILTKCRVLVISKSSYGDLTSFLRGTNTNLYSFGDGTVSPSNYTTQDKVD